MPNATEVLPEKIDPAYLFRFAKILDGYSQHDRLNIAFPKGVFFSPFTMLFIAAKINWLRSKCPNLQLFFDGWDQYEYLSHMGFFTMCGVNHGKDVGQAAGSLNYIPISRITRGSLYEKDLDKYEEMGDLIQRQADKVALILARDKYSNRNLFDVLSYSIREMFRNVFEHGETDELYFCAQYWPKSNKVEFAVTDFGVGIRRGLAKNPNFLFTSDKQALECALLPSVSGKTHLPRTSSTWFNSGYGLYMTSRLARNGGNFAIASGNDAFQLHKTLKSNFQTSFSGTAIRVNLDIDAIGEVQKRLSEFREEGKKIAESIRGSGNRPPSAMSLLLRRDYQ